MEICFNRLNNNRNSVSVRTIKKTFYYINNYLEHDIL